MAPGAAPAADASSRGIGIDAATPSAGPSSPRSAGSSDGGGVTSDGKPATEPSDAPSNGAPALITGAVFTGLGGSFFISVAATCPTKFQGRANENSLKVCYELGFGLAGGTAGIGLVLLLIGGVQRSGFNEWKRANQVARHIEATPLPGGAAGGFHGSF